MREASILARTASEEKRHGWSDKKWLVISILLLVYLLFSFLLFDPKLHTGGDNAHYICLARSLLAGKGYRDIFMPGAPPHSLYPFGFPVLLTIFMSVFRNSFVALKVLSILMGAGSILVAYALFKKRCTKSLLFAVVLLFAVHPLLLEYNHWILSDVSFTFFSLLSLFLFRKAEIHKREFSTVFLGSIVCMVFTYYIRPIGAVLLLGLLLHLGFRRRFKRVLILLAAMVVLLLPWSIRTARVSQGGGYLRPFMLKNPYDEESGRIGPKDGLGRLRSNSETYFIHAIPTTVLTMRSKLWSIPRKRWDLYSFGFLVSGIMLLGFAEELRRGVRLIHYYIILYMGMLLVWPQVWATERFILPLVPFVLFYFLNGGLLLAGKFSATTKRSLGLFVAVLLVAASVRMMVPRIPASLRAMRVYARGDRTAGYPPEWVNYFEAATYASKFTLADAIFMVRKPALFYLFAERKAVRYPFTFDKEKVIESMKENNVAYVVLDAFTWTQTTKRYLMPAVIAHQKDFQVIYRTGPPRTFVLGYNGG